MDDSFVLAGRRFTSRLIVGTGKYRDLEQTREALARSGAEIVTVALRRVELVPGQPSLLDAIDPKRYVLLPNTAGCYDADEAIRTCHLARELGMTDFVKLEIIGDRKTLFPDAEETLRAAKILVKEGFVVLPCANDESGDGAQARGGRVRGGDAVGGADRIGPRHSQSHQPPLRRRSRRGRSHDRLHPRDRA